MNLKQALLRIKPVHYYFMGKLIQNDATHLKVQQLSNEERGKRTARSEVINFLLAQFSRPTTYLEIGVRDPGKNFDKIVAGKKYSVDPGIEFESNPVDFPFTSDAFFTKLERGEVLDASTRFDVIFIDGLHLAEQVDRDVRNALRFLKDDGFIVMHDCNPPSEWHARESHNYRLSPAGNFWNGSTWKAFVKWRCNSSIYSCCIDTDWGVGILSKKWNVGEPLKEPNEFYEFSRFEQHRAEELNLIAFDAFKKKVHQLLSGNPIS
jgi:SAM-dependent methyltransferase